MEGTRLPRRPLFVTAHAPHSQAVAEFAYALAGQSSRYCSGSIQPKVPVRQRLREILWPNPAYVAACFERRP